MVSLKKLIKMPLRGSRRHYRFLRNCRKRNVSHLFLLSPPLSGSTAIAQLLNTSKNISVFPGNGEGQYLRPLKKVLLVDQRWNPDLVLDWRAIRNVFFHYWDPRCKIRLEKSPPNIIRARAINRVFENSLFLITIRNPYAQIEGFLRRDWPFGAYGPQTSEGDKPTAVQAAEFWVKCAHYQKLNLESLENTCFFSYEDLTDNTEATVSKIMAFLPNVADLSSDATFTAHNVTGSPVAGLVNLNESKINNLSGNQLASINSVLEHHVDLLRYFGYELISDV